MRPCKSYEPTPTDCTGDFSCCSLPQRTRKNQRPPSICALMVAFLRQLTHAASNSQALAAAVFKRHSCWYTFAVLQVCWPPSAATTHDSELPSFLACLKMVSTVLSTAAAEWVHHLRVSQASCMHKHAPDACHSQPVRRQPHWSCRIACKWHCSVTGAPPSKEMLCRLHATALPLKNMLTVTASSAANSTMGQGCVKRQAEQKRASPCSSGRHAQLASWHDAV